MSSKNPKTSKKAAVSRIDRIKRHEDIAEHVGAGLRMGRFPAFDRHADARSAAEERSSSSSEAKPERRTPK